MSLETRLTFQKNKSAAASIKVSLDIPKLAILMKKTQLANMVRLIEFSYDYRRM